MKIAIEARPIKWSNGTGIGNYTYCLIQKLGEIDLQNDYTFLWPDQNLASQIPFPKIKSFYALPKEDEREEIEIPLWLAKEKADIFHLPQNGFRTPKKIKHTKLVVTIHDLIPYFVPEMVRPSFLKRFMAEMPEIIDRADHIITVSETSKQDLMRIFAIKAPKISVVPSAPGKLFRPLPKTEVQKALRTRHHLKRPYILYAGGLNPRKNIGELICAFAKICRELPSGEQLVILGPAGKHREKLKELAEALGLKDDIVFPGFIDAPELPLFYNGAALFVYPSIYEGFGLPPIEAMACGIPVITSNVSSLPEVVQDAALTVNPHDTLRLAETMHRVLTDEALTKALSEKGLSHCRKYNWDNIARKILNIYYNLLEDSPG